MGGRLVLTGAEVDLDSGTARRGAEAVELTRREVELLAYLAARPGADVSREELLVQVWGWSPNARTRAIDNMVRKVRAKVELDPDRPRHVRTVPGGYRFEPVRDLGPDTRYGDAFVGREDLLSEVEQALTSGRPVALSGLPGVGKTRLAWEVLRRWSAGDRWFLPVAEPSSDALVGAVAGALGVPAGQARTTADLADRVAWSLGARGPALLVLDDLDPDPATTPVVARWMRDAPELRVLVTSRLDHPDWTAVKVGSLRRELASALFIDRARRVWPAFAPDDATVRLCDELDGLPLALELAAARTAVLAPSAILERLQRGVEVLRAPGGAALERALAWSWDLLDDDDRTVLACATTFVDPFPTEAGEAVCGDLDRLHALAERSWLQRLAEGGAVVLRLAAPVRAFVAARVPVPSRARDAHLDWFVARMAADRDRVAPAFAADLRAALGWALDTAPDRAADLASELSLALDWHAAQDERASWLERALAAGPSAERRARLRMHLTQRYAGAGRHDVAREMAAAAADDAREAGTPVARALAASAEAGAALLRGDLAEARAGYEAALGEPITAALRSSATQNLAHTLFRMGRIEAALEGFHAGIGLAREAGLRRAEAGALNGIALCVGRLEGPDAAEPWAREAERTYAEAGDAQGTVVALLNRAFRGVARGDAACVAEAVAEARDRATRAGDRLSVAVCDHQLASSLLDQRRLPEAIAAFRSAVGHLVVLAAHAPLLQARLGLAVARTLAGEPDGPAALREVAAAEPPNPPVQAVAWAILALATGSAEARAAVDRLAPTVEGPLVAAAAALVVGGDAGPVQALASWSYEARLLLGLGPR